MRQVILKTNILTQPMMHAGDTVKVKGYTAKGEIVVESSEGRRAKLKRGEYAEQGKEA